MSFHYTVCVSTQLRSDLAAVDIAMLEYLFNEAGDLPAVEPDDSLRSAVLEMDWLRKWFAGAADPSMASCINVARMPDGRILSASLALFSPGHKLEGIFEDWPKVFRWLATLIVWDGHFATVICEDGGEGAPGLYYAYDGKLFMKSEKELNVVLAYDSDERRELPAR